MYSNILVPVAFDTEHEPTNALGIAQALCAEGASITVLHVVEHVPAYAMAYIPEDYQRDLRASIQSSVDELAAKLPNAKGVVVEGHSGRTILDFAEANGNDCIVIDSHRPGMQDLLLGSTAARVVRHATCAVHVMR